jgi:hypothetical protein
VEGGEKLDRELLAFEEQFVDKSDGAVKIDFASVNKMIVKDLQKPYLGERLLRKYDTDTVKQFMQFPERYQRQLRDVSIGLYNVSTHYKRLILYFAHMLTLDYIIVPWGSTVLASKNKKTIQSSYNKVVDYLETLNVKHEFKKVLTVAIREDVFYGYLYMSKDSSYIQKFDADYCQITSVEDGTFCFSFDFAYFQNNPDKLELFPSDFKPMYDNYVSDPKAYRWQELDPNKTICLKFHEDLQYCLPVFVGIFADIFSINDYKALRKTKTKLGNYKLIAQKIPIEEKSTDKNDFKITLPLAQQFHANISSTLPEEIGVITSPMDVTALDFNRDLTEIDNVKNAVRDMMTGAGVNELLFNAETSGSIGLTKSINVDESIMFSILRQIERIVNFKLKKIGGSRHKISMPDITVYNREDLFAIYKQAGDAGFPVKSLIGACIGLSPSDLASLMFLENDVLQLHENMLPLPSSHTISHDGTDLTGGRPTKSTNKLSDEGGKTRDNNKNAK